MIDIVEILVHWYAGRSKNEMAASLGVDRKTIRKYKNEEHEQASRGEGVGNGDR